MWKVFLLGLFIGIVLTFVTLCIFMALIGKSVDELYDEDEDNKY